jgi:hypothetical protein
MKLQSPYIDVWAGQTWHLFGLQGYFQPPSLEIQGTPAQLYSRTAQLRLSHAFKTSPVDIEIAAAALRPPQRNAGIPDAAAGLKLSVNGWKGVHTTGAATTAVDAAAIGVSGVYRQFELPELSPTPMSRVHTTGQGVSIDAFLPVIPGASVKDRSNALSLTGSFVTGAGIADLYSGLTGGVGFPAPPNPMMTTPAPTYTADVDNGLVSFDPNTGELKAVQWTTFMASVQYYLPPSGKVFISGVYSQGDSNNADQFGAPGKVITKIQWASGNIFWDALPSVRVGAAYGWTKQRYADNVDATNHRVQIIGLYIF